MWFISLTVYTIAQAPVKNPEWYDFIYDYRIFTWSAMTWLKVKVPEY